MYELNCDYVYDGKNKKRKPLNQYKDQDELEKYHKYIRELTIKDIGKVIIKVKPGSSNDPKTCDYMGGMNNVCVLEAITNKYCRYCGCNMGNTNNQCQYCKCNTNNEILKCLNCLDAYYCSSYCRDKGWTYHKSCVKKPSNYREGEKELIISVLSDKSLLQYPITPYGWVVWDEIKQDIYVNKRHEWSLIKKVEELKIYGKYIHGSYQICVNCKKRFGSFFSFQDRDIRTETPFDIEKLDEFKCATPWEVDRLFFISILKNQNNEFCYMRLLPKDIINEIRLLCHKSATHDLVSII